MLLRSLPPMQKLPPGYVLPRSFWALSRKARLPCIGLEALQQELEVMPSVTAMDLLCYLSLGHGLFYVRLESFCV